MRDLSKTLQFSEVVFCFPLLQGAQQRTPIGSRELPIPLPFHRSVDQEPMNWSNRGK